MQYKQYIDTLANCTYTTHYKSKRPSKSTIYLTQLYILALNTNTITHTWKQANIISKPKTIT